MEKIKIEIVDAALFQLFLKHSRRIVAGRDLMPRVLAGQIPFLPGIRRQNLSDDDLAHSAMVRISGIEIVHAMLQRVSCHLSRLRFINRISVLQQRQAHRPESKL